MKQPLALSLAGRNSTLFRLANECHFLRLYTRHTVEYSFEYMKEPLAVPLPRISRDDDICVRSFTADFVSRMIQNTGKSEIFAFLNVSSHARLFVCGVFLCACA